MHLSGWGFWNAATRDASGPSSCTQVEESNASSPITGVKCGRAEDHILFHKVAIIPFPQNQYNLNLNLNLNLNITKAYRSRARS